MPSTTATTPVPSWAVTTEQLASWGFPVRITDKICGTPVVMREGMSMSAAIFAAWCAGFVRMAGEPTDVREARQEAGRARREAVTADVGLIGWFRETGRFRGPEWFREGAE